MKPIALTDGQLLAIQRAADPLHPQDRGPYLEKVAEMLNGHENPRRPGRKGGARGTTPISSGAGSRAKAGAEPVGSRRACASKGHQSARFRS
jgi:hypothetical protein